MMRFRCTQKTDSRGQVSIMIILGIIILFTFVLLSATVSENRERQQEASQASIQNDFSERFPIDEYIKTCLQEVTYDGITLLLSQGGNIYSDQDGLVIPNASAPRLRVRDNVISYGIVRQRMANDSFYLPPPAYPFEDDFVQYQKGWPYYGQKKIPPLCIPEGANNESLSFVTCKEYGPRSIQEQLQHYISTNLMGCLSGLQNISYYLVEQDQPEVTVVLGNDDVRVRTSSALEIERGGTRVAVPANISARVPVRLKTIYDFTYDLINAERYDLFFDIMAGYETWIDRGQYDSAFRVDKACPLCAQGIIDSVITVTDRQSLIRGIPLQFRFVIQNRPPVLDWIHTTPRNMTEQDIVISEREELQIRPNIYDPDEDAQFVVSYSGWHEDYLSFFQDSACAAHCTSFDCPPTAYQQFCQQKLVFSPQNKPHNLTQSNLFQSTQRAANIPLNRNDLGFHTIRVMVEDRAGLRDWQDVNILVTDEVFPDAGSSGNIYNIQKQYTTIEDPYILNASRTTYYSGGTDFLNYNWDIFNSADISIYNIHTTENATSYPTDYSDISLITTQGFHLFGNYSIILEANEIGGTTPHIGGHNVTVGQCFKDLNGSERSSIMYPFNTDNPYYANRYCCKEVSPSSPLGVYANQSTECHNQYVTQGNLLDLSQEYPSWSYQGISDEIRIPGRPVYTSINAVPIEYTNDLFVLRFKRYCSGTRGNVCTGPVKRVFEFKTRAEDYDFPYGMDLRCQGYQGTTLVRYTQNTFEQTQLPTTYNLIPWGANPNYCYSSSVGVCSDPIPRDNPATGLNETGPYNCRQAECLGGECRSPDPSSCRCDAIDCTGESVCQGIPLDLMDSTESLLAFNPSTMGAYLTDQSTPLFVAAQDGSYTVNTPYCDMYNRIRVCTEECGEDTLAYFMSEDFSVTAPDGVVYSFTGNTGCDADRECALYTKGDNVNYPNITRGCDETGIYTYCFPYLFNETSAECRSSAGSIAECAQQDTFFDEFSPSNEYEVIYKSMTSECIVCETYSHMREFEPPLPSTVEQHQAMNYDFTREDACSIDCGASPVCDGIYESEFEVYNYLGIPGTENQKMLFMYYIDNSLPTPSYGYCDSLNRVRVCNDICHSLSSSYFMSNSFSYTYSGITRNYPSIPGCNADTECDLRTRGQISTDIKSRACNASGQYIYCAPYAANPTTGNCYTEAPDASYCAESDDPLLRSLSSNYFVAHEPPVGFFGTGKCLICDSNSGREVTPNFLPSGISVHQAYDFTTPLPGRCNRACGADSICDGRTPQQNPQPGQCNMGCSYVS